jgi:hypothetical protein
VLSSKFTRPSGVILGNGSVSENMWRNGGLGVINVNESEFIKMANEFDPFNFR